VVQEIQIGGNWQIYDPDLSVYYYNRDNTLASVSQLVSSPDLVDAPTSPILDLEEYAYSPNVAGVYGSTDDNALADDLVPYLVADVPHIDGTIELPAGATVTYPGIWGPVMPGITAGTLYDVHAVANLRMDIPAGWTGKIRLPLMLSAVYGTGNILVDGKAITGGKYELPGQNATFTKAPAYVNIQSSTSPVTIVFLLNPVRFVMQPHNDVQLLGANTSALTIDDIDLGVQEAAPDLDAIEVVEAMKPRPTEN